MRKEIAMGRHRKREKRHAAFIFMLTVLLAAQMLPAAEGNTGSVYAASPEKTQFELEVSEDLIYYGDWFTRLMQFKFKDTGETERAYCMNPELYPPGEGTHTATIYNYKNVPDHYRPLWKALYYLEGGPGYAEVAQVWDSVYHYDPAAPDTWSSGRAQVYALSHMVVSELSPVGSTGTVGTGAEYIDLMNAMIKRIQAMPDPPKTFQIAVYVSGSDYQNISGYCAPLSVTGTLRLIKKCADPSVSANNTSYSLEGAEYGVYLDESCSSKVGAFVTDADGRAKDLTLEEGTYYVREENASPGYVCDRTVHTAEVVADEITEVISDEMPQRTEPEWLVFKTDRESGKDHPKGGASLENAVFEVAYYAGQFETREEAEQAGVVARTWHFKTDENGRIGYRDSYLVDGDALFTDADGALMIPCGTLFIRETGAPKGYLINDSTSVIHIRPVSGQTAAVIPAESIGLPAAVSDQVMRGGFRFNKLKEGSAEAVSMVPFRLTSVTTGESHILVTDANGIADTESYAHETNCNANDQAVGEDGSVDASALDPAAGIWFTGYADSGDAAPSNAQKALPYDTYQVEELRCEANQGYRLASFQVRIDRDQVMIDRGTVTDYKDISIGTSALCDQTASHYAPQIGPVTITDTVRYEDAKTGDVYHLEGILMDRETGQPVEADGKPVTASKDFAALHRDGAVRLTFEADAADLAGRTTVVYETLYRNGEKVAEHTDLKDENQTIRFPLLATKAARQKDGTVVDHVVYSGLKAGETYTMTARLVDPDTEEPVKGAEGSLSFIPDSETGSIDVPIDVSRAESGVRVVFERCTKDGHLVALHEDTGSKEQTVLLPAPKQEKPAPAAPYSTPRTGDPGTKAVWFVMAAAAAAATAGFARRKEQTAE